MVPCVAAPHYAVLPPVMVLVVLAWPEVVGLVRFDPHWKNLKEVVLVVHVLVVYVWVVVDQA